MKSRLLLIGIVLMSSAASALADDVLDRFETRQYQTNEKETLLYRLLKPQELKEGEKYPLVLFLHGAGERGDDNQKQLVHGMSDFASDEVMKKHPAFVVAPQCPAEERWANVDWSADSHALPAKPSDSLRLSLGLLDVLQKEFPIDANRIYITGLSMGGYGTWDAIAREPQRFAAALPICGGGDPATAEKFAGLPIWVFHGGQDTVVKPQRSRVMVEALKKAGGEPKYTEYPDAAHNSWSATYANREVLDWLFDQQRSAATP